MANLMKRAAGLCVIFLLLNPGVGAAQASQPSQTTAETDWAVVIVQLRESLNRMSGDAETRRQLAIA